MRKWIKRCLKTVLVAGIVAGIGCGGWYGYRFVRSFRRGPTHAIRRVEARVDAGEDNATVRLTVEIAGPGPMRSSRVPILPSGVSLVEASVDGDPAEMDLIDGRPAVVVSGGGTRKVELVYALPLSGERKLVLALPRGISTTVELALPKPGQTVKVPSPAIVEILPGGKGTLARIVTPPVDRVDVTWFPKPTEVVTSARKAARTETLYTIQGDSLAARTVFSLRVDGRDVSSLVFDLAAGVVVDQVEAPWVKGWKVEGGKLVVQASGPLGGQTTLTVHHRRPLGEEEVDLGVPVLREAVRQWGFGAVATGGSVEIKALTVEGGTAIDPRGLPESLRSAGAAPVARAFRYDSVPSSQKLVLVRHRELETLEATCDVLNALLTYTPDGRCMGKAVYTVRNARRQHLRIRLPEKAKLWSAYVAGKPVRPSETGDGKLLVPLSCSAKTASRGFAVELVYYLPGAAFAEKGKFSAALPVVEIPVMGVMLSVSVPEDINLEDFSGGLKQVEAFAFALDPRDDAVIREEQRRNPKSRVAADLNGQLEQQIAGGQQGNRRLRIDYQELVKNPNYQKAVRWNNDNKNFVRQYYLENAQSGNVADAPGAGNGELNLTGFGQEELAEITGLASLSMAVPSGGRVYRFERQLLLGEAAEISADYWSALAARARPDAELRLAGKSAAAYGLSQHGMKFRAELAYSVTSGKADSLVYAIPAGARILSVRGANVAEWTSENGKLAVRLVRPERTGGTLVVSAELPAVEKGEAVLTAPRLDGARTEELLVAVSAPESYELVFPEVGKLEPLALGALPAALRNGSEHTSVFRLNARNGASVRVKAVHRSTVSALRATCDSVNAISFYTAEGVGVTRAVFEIRNSGRRHLEVTLPEGARLWGAFVADRAVKPLAGEKGSVLLPLDMPAGGGVSSYPVEVVYVLPGKPFERRGRFEASLPRVNVPVMHVMYSLYVPRRMRLGRPDGSLKQVREFSGPVTPPASSVGRPGAAAAGIGALDNRAKYQSRQMALELNVSQRKLERALGNLGRGNGKNGGNGRKPGDGAAHERLAACGVKVYIPAVGRLLRFERHLAVDGEMSMSCAYRN